MKPFIIFAFMLISIPLSKKQLSDFKWENRLIITFDIPKKDFAKVSPTDLKDRKVLFFAFESGNLINSNFESEIEISEFLKLHEKYQADYFLIGLDGGVKSSGKSKDFSLEKLMKKIDSMPLRQSELRRKNG